MKRRPARFRAPQKHFDRFRLRPDFPASEHPSVVKSSSLSRACRSLGCGLSAALILTACHKQGEQSSGSGPASAADRRTFCRMAWSRSWSRTAKTVVIQHEAITNYMAAMTMPFEVRDSQRVERIAARRCHYLSPRRHPQRRVD